jgi:hypothetical protein
LIGEVLWVLRGKRGEKEVGEWGFFFEGICWGGWYKRVGRVGF